MSISSQWKRLIIGGTAALTLTAGALWAVDNSSIAAANDLLPAQVSQQLMEFAGRGGQGGHGPGGGLDMHGGAFGLGDQQQYLADALGITVEELASAQESVRNAQIDQAVADGLLTQEQAEQLKAGERLRIPGLKMKGGVAKADATDHEALLADALGITIEELDAAQSAAKDAAIADALAEGTITQEQVDLMNANQALREYLRTAYTDERPTAMWDELIQEAVTAGALTQEQADLLLSNQGPMGQRGHGEFDGDRGRGMDRPERGGPGMRAPGADGTEDDNGTIPDGTQQNRNNGAPQNSSDGNL